MNATLRQCICKSLIVIAMLTVANQVTAQVDTESTSQLIADIFEQYTAESEDEIDFSSFYEDLMFLALNPININNANPDLLNKLPFLSDIQVENILEHIHQFGALNTIYELQLINGLDMTDIRRMLPFVYVGDAAAKENKIYWRDVLKYGKSELITRFDNGLETKEGYQNPLSEETDTAYTNNKYNGNAIYNSIRYRFHFKDKIHLGFIAEKDAGEPFDVKKLTAHDFYSFTLQMNDVNRFKTIVVGDFRANFGEGLVLRPEFGTGKSSYVLNVTPKNSGIKKYSSTDESNFFRGGGATFRAGKFDISAFYSNKMIDADTIGQVFASWYKTGLHRTVREIDTKNSVNQQIVGGDVSYKTDNFKIGLVAVSTLFNQNYIIDSSSYNLHYFRGQSLSNVGIHYKTRLLNFNLFGETALSYNGAMATINGCTFSPTSLINFVVLHRNYAPNYNSFYATAFAESSRINNEKGIYIGAVAQPIKNWKISGYADSFQFPWLKFGVDAPSLGKDILLQIDYTPKRTITMNLRYRYGDKEKNVDTDQALSTIYPYNKSTLRYNIAYIIDEFRFKNTIEYNLTSINNSNGNYGFMAAQDVTYKPSNLPLKIDFRYMIFDITNYENRIYSYENDILYAFSVPMYYGLGSRVLLNLKYEWSRSFSIWFKIAQTIYADDRQSISSSNEQIVGNRKTDMRLLLKYDF